MKKALTACLLGVSVSGCIRLPSLDQPLPNLDEIANSITSGVPYYGQIQEVSHTSESEPKANWEHVKRLLGKEFAQAQPQADLRNFLGEPTSSEPGRDIWAIAGATDGVQAETRFIVDYNQAGVAVSWYTFGGIDPAKKLQAFSPYLVGALYFEPFTLVIK